MVIVDLFDASLPTQTAMKRKTFPVHQSKTRLDATERSVQKASPAIARPAISDSSLCYVPEDVHEGFEERIETGIEWTVIERAARHHREVCKAGVSTVTFTQALQSKVDNSIFGSFLNEKCGLTLDQQWELLLPITLWDNEKFSNEEGKICFRNANNITDNMVKMIKRAVRLGDREILRKELKAVHVLRVNDSKMTDLDEKLLEFDRVFNLNLCGNYIEDLDASMIPSSVKSLELQANGIKSVENFAEYLPQELFYLGLAINFLNNESVSHFSRFPSQLTVLDLADNDIRDLLAVLEALANLPNLTSLTLAGNPCAVCMGYARVTLLKLPLLQWLDLREVLPTDRPVDTFEPHPDDLRSSYFYFTVLRVMSAVPPPKTEKGAITTFHVELEIPLLDSTRRQFLMFRNNDSLIEMLPPPEYEEYPSKMPSAVIDSKLFVPDEASSHASDIYKVLEAKNSLEIHNYTTFESNRVQWNKVMNFVEPTVKIFCPDLAALKKTFNTVITVRLVYSLTITAKQAKPDKKAPMGPKPPSEQRVVLATIRCALRRPDWSQPFQHFHWDDSLGTNEAIHWGDGDLSVLQYNQAPAKPTKGKSGQDTGGIDSRQLPPDNLTCHFSFGLEMQRA